MPLLSHITLGGSQTNLMVWRILESEDWFRGQLPVIHTPGHPQRRLQHLAGRFLLAQVDPAFPYADLRVTEHGRPFIEDGSRHFSITHTGNMAAVIMSRDHAVGVDLELVTPRVLKVASRFLGLAERSWIGSAAGTSETSPGKLYGTEAMRLCTLLWSAKEAAYKWLGVPGLDFAADLEIEPFQPEMAGEIKARCRKDGDLSFRIGYQCIEGAWLTWVNEPLTFHRPDNNRFITG
jgi:phosphopantetheinyl transferase